MVPQEFAKFDILAWWKGNLTFPVLSIRRIRLTPASLEMYICLKDHLDAAERIQHISSLEGELDIEQELYDIEVEAGFAILLSDEEIALDEAANEVRLPLKKNSLTKMLLINF
ncbi:hypothetical protein Tco_0465034 [Tanacetum coccineum]